MNFSRCIASNMVGIIILLIILFNYKIKNFSQRKGDEKLFIIMIILNISVLFIDSAMWYLDGKRFSGNFTLLMIFSIIYYLIQPLICFIWLVYCEYKIKLSIKPIRKKILFYSIPLLISTILTFVTLVKPTFFYID